MSFLPLEVAALKGISVSAATWLIRDIVNLGARHPLLWTMVRRGQVPVWRACQLTAEVAQLDLSAEEAGELDVRLAPKIAGLPWRRVLQLVRGLVAEIAAGKVQACSERARAERFVRKLPTDDPTVAYLSAQVDTADAIFFDAAVDRIADILGDRGDTDNKDVRRAKAVGVLATPERARLMLAEAAGTTRVEGVGPLAATMLKLLVGNCQIKVAPVIRPYAEIAVDSYEIPDWMRNQILLRDQIEVFPYSCRSARRQDLDHTVPYRAGVTGQTRASNLGPLSRKAHRGKTHGGWRLEQPRPGIFWWTSPAGHQYRVGPGGTRPYNPITWRIDHDPGPEGDLDSS
jgi:hypothetical protein